MPPPHPDAAATQNGDAAPDAIVRFLDGVRDRIGTVVVGQDVVVERILIALFTGGHLLLQGVPGLAKTLLVVLPGEVDRPLVRAHPVHHRPAAVRHPRARRSSTSGPTSSG